MIRRMKWLLAVMPALALICVGKVVFRIEIKSESFTSSGTEVRYHLANKADVMGPERNLFYS